MCSGPWPSSWARPQDTARARAVPCIWQILASAFWGSPASSAPPYLLLWAPPWAARCSRQTGCENNQYAVTTHFNDTVAVKNISDRAAAYAMPGVLVDGQDVVAMYEAVKEAVDRARAGQGPSLIEGKTYRYHDHSEGIRRIGALDRDPYRTDEEMEYWMGRDPITIHKELLIEHTMATEGEIEEVEAQMKAQIEEALEFARTSPYPEPEAIFEDMYASPIPIDMN